MSMYLSHKINQAVSSLSLEGKQSHDWITESCRAALKPFGVRVTHSYSQELSGYDYTVSGQFQSDRKRMPILLCIFYSLDFGGSFQWTKTRRRQFKFLLSQVTQHELIHKHQSQYRDEMMGYSGNEMMEYLANKDEIGAYAHDIKMEIEHYYGASESFDVLRKVGSVENLTSYELYKKVFKGSKWNRIQKRLLKQTYKWMEN